MMASDPTRTFAMRNFYAMERLERPGLKRDTIFETSAFSYGPTRFAGSCAEMAEVEIRDAIIVDLPAPDVPDTGFDHFLNAAGAHRPSSMATLSTLLRYTYGFLRWEPFNDYKQHRAVPSPRSLFPLDLYLTVGNGTVYRYLPDQHGLVLERTGGSGDAVGIAIVAALGHLPPYGELTPALAFVEAGALSAQIAFIARLLGWRIDLAPVSDAAASRALLGLHHWSEVPTVEGVLSVPGLAASLAQSAPDDRKVATRKSRSSAMDVFPVLRDFIAAAEQPSARGACDTECAASPVLCSKTVALPRPGRSMTFLDVVARRSSGCRVGGLVGRADAPARLTALLEDAAGLAAVLPVRSAPEIRIVMTVFANDDIKAGDYELELATGLVRRLRDGSDSAFHDYESYYEINFASLVATFSLCFDLSRAAAFGPNAFALAHQRAGEIVQMLSLAASASGLFARPYRSFRGQVFQAHAGIDCEPLLQVIVGSGRSGNPALGGAVAS